MDERRGDKLADILPIHTTGRDEFDPAKGTRECLHRGKTAIDAGREELHDLEAELHRGHDLCRGNAAGSHGDAIVHAPADDLFVKAGRNDELCAALDGFFALLERDDGARADEHVGAVFGDSLDGIRSSSRAERDLHHIHTAGKQSLRRRDRVLCIVQHDHRHNSRSCKSFRNIHS